MGIDIVCGFFEGGDIGVAMRASALHFNCGLKCLASLAQLRVRGRSLFFKKKYYDKTFSVQKIAKL